jgi:hypothetical protein
MGLFAHVTSYKSQNSYLGLLEVLWTLDFTAPLNGVEGTSYLQTHVVPSLLGRLVCTDLRSQRGHTQIRS